MYSRVAYLAASYGDVGNTGVQHMAYSSHGIGCFTNSSSASAYVGTGVPGNYHKEGTYENYARKVFDQMGSPGSGHGNTLNYLSAATQDPYTSYTSSGSMNSYGKEQRGCLGAIKSDDHQVFDELSCPSYGYGKGNTAQGDGISSFPSDWDSFLRPSENWYWSVINYGKKQAKGSKHQVLEATSQPSTRQGEEKIAQGKSEDIHLCSAPNAQSVKKKIDTQDELLKQLAIQLDVMIESNKKLKQEMQRKHEQAVVDKELKHFFQHAFDLFNEMPGKHYSKPSLSTSLEDSCISSVGLHEFCKGSEGAKGSSICDPNISVKDTPHMFDELQQPEDVNVTTIHYSDIPVQHMPYVLDETPNKDGKIVHFVHELSCGCVDSASLEVREGIGDACPLLDKMPPWRRSAFSPGYNGLEGVNMVLVQMLEAKLAGPNASCVNEGDGDGVYWSYGMVDMVTPSPYQFGCGTFIQYKTNQITCQARKPTNDTLKVQKEQRKREHAVLEREQIELRPWPPPKENMIVFLWYIRLKLFKLNGTSSAQIEVQVFSRIVLSKQDVCYWPDRHVCCLQHEILSLEEISDHDVMRCTKITQPRFSCSRESCQVCKYRNFNFTAAPSPPLSKLLTSSPRLGRWSYDSDSIHTLMLHDAIDCDIIMGNKIQNTSKVGIVHGKFIMIYHVFSRSKEFSESGHYDKVLLYSNTGSIAVKKFQFQFTSYHLFRSKLSKFSYPMKLGISQPFGSASYVCHIVILVSRRVKVVARTCAVAISVAYSEVEQYSQQYLLLQLSIVPSVWLTLPFEVNSHRQWAEKQGDVTELPSYRVSPLVGEYAWLYPNNGRFLKHLCSGGRGTFNKSTFRSWMELWRTNMRCCIQSSSQKKCEILDKYLLFIKKIFGSSNYLHETFEPERVLYLEGAGFFNSYDHFQIDT